MQGKHTSASVWPAQDSNQSRPSSKSRAQLTKHTTWMNSANVYTRVINVYFLNIFPSLVCYFSLLIMF